MVMSELGVVQQESHSRSSAAAGLLRTERH